MNAVFRYVSARAKAEGSLAKPQCQVDRATGDVVIALNPAASRLTQDLLGSVASQVLASTEAIRARFASNQKMMPQELQKLALPLKRSARQLGSIDVVDKLMARSGPQPSRDAAMFAAAVILYERTPLSYFPHLIASITNPHDLRNATVWRLLQALRRYLADTKLTEEQRLSLIDALRRYAKNYDEGSGKRFVSGSIINLTRDIAKHRELKLRNRLDSIFSDEQLTELVAQRIPAERPKPIEENSVPEQSSGTVVEVVPAPDIAVLSNKILDARVKETDAIMRNLSGFSGFSGTAASTNPWLDFWRKK